MKAPAPSHRTVVLLVSVVLVIAGAVVASITVLGGSTMPNLESPRRPAAQTPDAPKRDPSADPTSETRCLLYDFECQAEGGSAVVPRRRVTSPATC
ncbi:hypothetical protein [Streptomyces sp. CC224B]|uniref:hypothetical protein n=1 Tax=Streptomyces sp. CC224B TaxID=3044571 RepID=UPI0024A9DC5B|nr:hypothetical protein [Streptomyces sp. CC224B]